MGNATISVQFVTEESKASGDIAEIEKSGGKLDAPPSPFDVPADLVDDYSDAQFEPLTIIAATVATAFLVKRISDIWLDHSRPGGQVVDTRGGKTVVRVAPYLKRGTLVLQSEQEVKVFEPNDKDEALPFLAKVLGHG
jgi:hypothetical protein